MDFNKGGAMKKAQSLDRLILLLWVFFISNSSFGSLSNSKLNVQENPIEKLDSKKIENIKSLNNSTSEKSKNLTDSNQKGSAVNKETHWLCRKSMEVRTIRVHQNEDSCFALYTKKGLDEKVLSAKTVDGCAPMVLQVKENLEKGGWYCKDISNSSISK